MFDDRRKLETDFIKFVDICNKYGVFNNTCCDGVHESIPKAVVDAIKNKAFCSTFIGWLGAGTAYEILLLEYLTSNSAQGYHMSSVDPRAFIKIKNVGHETINYTMTAKAIKRPENPKLYTTGGDKNFLRKYGKIEPGEEKTLPFGKGYSLLQKHCELAHHEYAARLGLPLAQPNGRVMEIGGGITSYSEEEDDFVIGNKVIYWGDMKSGSVRSSK